MILDRNRLNGSKAKEIVAKLILSLLALVCASMRVRRKNVHPKNEEHADGLESFSFLSISGASRRFLTQGDSYSSVVDEISYSVIRLHNQFRITGNQ